MKERYKKVEDYYLISSLIPLLIFYSYNIYNSFKIIGKENRGCPRGAPI